MKEWQVTEAIPADTLEVIRDIYSKASQGVLLTWVTLWDAQTAFQAGACKRVDFRIT